MKSDEQWLRRFGLDKLSRERERELSQRILDGDRDALDTLVRSNFWLVIQFIQKVPASSHTRAEVLSACLFRLYRALSIYDARGASSTLAHKVIYRAGNLAIRNSLTFFGNKVAKYRNVVEKNRNLSDEQLASVLGCTTKRVNLLRRTVTPAVYRLDATVEEQPTSIRGLITRRGSWREEGETRLRDVLDTQVDDSYETTLDQERLQHLNELINTKLNPRQRRILADRSEGKTLGEIGQEWGVHRERVRQIESQAIRKIQEVLQVNLGWEDRVEFCRRMNISVRHPSKNQNGG